LPAIPPPAPTPETATVADSSPTKKCHIAQVLSPKDINLLKTAPENDTVRTVIHAKLKQAIPDDKKTYEDIEGWIETTFEAPKLPEAPKAAEKIEIGITAWDTENGRCLYSIRREGRGLVPILVTRLLELAEEADHMDELMANLEEEIGEMYYNYVSLECDYDEAEHTEHESNDNDDSTWDYISITARNDAIRNALARVAPEELRRLDGGE
jgi:hypothetical protein